MPAPNWRTPSRLRCLCGWVLALAGFVIASAAVAQPPGGASDVLEPEIALWLGQGDSDNIQRTSAAGESGSYRSVGLLLGLTRETPRLEAWVSSDLEFRRYSVESIDDETVGTFNGLALIDLVENWFAWSFEEGLNQGQPDPFAVVGPNNRETINVFTHGPRLEIPFGRTSLTASVSRSARRYDESTQIDNDNDIYQLALARTTSPTTFVALVAGTSETNYENDVAPTYEIDEVFLRIDKAQPHGRFTADIGTNEIGSGTHSEKSPLLNIDWTRSMRSRSTLGISASREFTDSGSDVTSGAGVFVTTAPFEHKRVDLTYYFTGERTTVSLAAGVGEEDYAGGTDLDNDFQNDFLTVAFRASVRLDLGIRYEQYDRESPESTGLANSQSDRTFGIWLNRTLGEKFGVALNVSRFEGSGIESIDETRTEIRFGYSPTGSTSSALRSTGR